MCLAWLERCPRRHLFLHMDINRTIIQVDAAGGRTFDDVLHSNAAANVMGVVDPHGHWTAVCGPHDTTALPSSSSLLSYDAYVDGLHRAPDTMQQLPPSQQREVWRRVTAARRAATRTFALPGHVGHAYAHLVDEQRRCLRVHTHNNDGDACDGRADATAASTATYHSIVPSFFVLVNALSRLDWPFTLLFRTFGSDLASVLDEWRRFVCGEHVCKPHGPVLQRMQRAYRAHATAVIEERDSSNNNASSMHAVLPRSACVYRAYDRVYLCYGPSVSAAAHMSATLPDHDDDKDNSGGDAHARVLAALRAMPGCDAVEEVSLRSFHARLRAYVACSYGVGGVVDYYPYWAQGAEQRSGGKLFPVTLPHHTRTHDNNNDNNVDNNVGNSNNNNDDDDCYYVFFDDNIALGDAHSIVDMRDARSGQSICDAAVEQAYCVPVNAYKAIVQPDYFVDALCQCLRRQQAALPS